MHIAEKVPYWRVLLKLRGTAIRRTWPRIAAVTFIAIIVTFFDLQSGQFHQDLTTTPFTLIGVALSIFLGFRNNTSYDRFWEGRKLWGAMVNVSRSLTRQIITLTGPTEVDASRLTEEPRNPYRESRPDPGIAEDELRELRAFHTEMVRRVAAYVHAFRCHLRDQDDREVLLRLLPETEVDDLEGETNRPVAILQTLGDRFREAWLRGWIHPYHLSVLEGSLTEMTGIQGGCERIKKTPIPFSYTVLIHRIVALYCLALPFGLVNSIQGLTPVVVAFVAFAFFGLDAVGDEIEDPFGTDANDLPLTNLSTMIERNIRQRVGDRDLPPMPPVKPGNFID